MESEARKLRIEIKHLQDIYPDFKYLKEELGWPMEMAGSGSYIKSSRTVMIHYPEGDVFLSFATLMHELGHPRQKDFNPKLKELREAGWEPEQTARFYEANETDAYQRGLQRVHDYAPETLQEMRDRFAKAVEQGSITEFESFDDFYDFVQSSTLINRAFTTVERSVIGEDAKKLKVQALKDAGVENFFKRYNGARVGEKIDTEWADEIIEKVAQGIVKE